VLTPVIYYGYRQRGTVGWLTRPRLHAIVHLMAGFAGSKTLAWLVGAIALCGVIGGWPRRSGRELSLTAVAVPWLLLPAAVLLAVSQIHPVYDPRYVAFSLPALALLAAAGLSWLTRIAGRFPLTHIGTRLAWAPAIMIVVLMGALLARPQWTVRQPNSRPDNLGKLAAIIAVNEQPGDAVLFVPSKLRATTYVNPAVWTRLRDVALARPPAASASLAGTQVSPALLMQRFASVSRVWLITGETASYSPTSRAELRMIGAIDLIGRWRVHWTVLSLYAKIAR
jgi:mannosyltransferase